MQRRNGMPFWCALSIKSIDPADARGGWGPARTSASARRPKRCQERTCAEAASRAKSEFLANMSHELRTLFTGLFGLLNLLRQSQLDEGQRRYLNWRATARRRCRRSSTTFSISKIEAGKLLIEAAAFSLPQLISSIATSHATAAERKGLRFTLDLGRAADRDPAATRFASGRSPTTCSAMPSSSPSAAKSG